MTVSCRQARRAGVLLPVSALPSGFGVGDLGPEAEAFASWLGQAGARIWQVLPVCPTDPAHGNSPYSSSSAFAGNPLLVSPEKLADDGLLSPEELDRARPEKTSRANYAAAAACRRQLLTKAFARLGSSGLTGEFRDFRRRHHGWLEDYALFTTIHRQREGQPWMRWPRALRERDAAALREARADLKAELEQLAFVQFCFFRQWEALHNFCRRQGVALFGDIPLYVDLDSAEVWSHPRAFQLNEQLRPALQAGVPPDYFSRSGQLWGNPIYDWERMKKTRFAWWRKRISHSAHLFDLVRLDHFRGLAGYWAVPSGARSARKGKWLPGPGLPLLQALRRTAPDLEIIAEDLGQITPDVRELMAACSLPGMRVVQFGFGPDSPRSEHVPHNFPRECVAYTGTHDNNTTRGWFLRETTAAARRRIFSYLGQEVSPPEVPEQLARLVLNSVAATAVVPAQDLLALGASARMNTPGKGKGNWTWRLRPGQLNARMGRSLRRLIEQSGRGAPGRKK